MAIRNQTQVLASQGLVRKGWNVIVREELGYKDNPAPKNIETRVSDPHFFLRIRIRAKTLMRIRIRIRILGVSGGGGWG